MFEFPTHVRFVVGDKTIDKPLEIDQQRHDFYFALDDEPQLVRFDPEYSVLARVTFRKKRSLLLTQLDPANDVIGRLRAIHELTKSKQKSSTIAAIGKTLKNDPFYGVRIAAARALRKLDTDASYEALLDGLDQEDARVRQAVVTELGHHYRPETLAKLVQLYDNESNPAIRGEIVSALGKFNGKQTQRIIRRALASDSFRLEELAAAINAVKAQQNKALLKTLRQTLADRGDELGSYVLARGLSTVAETGRQLKKKDGLREFIDGYLNHPKSTVRVAAVNALGKLGDPKSAGVLAALADNRDDRLAKAAKEAAKKLREETPLVPAEVKELRETIAKLRKDYDRLSEELEHLKLSSAASPSEGDPSSGDQETPLTEDKPQPKKPARPAKPSKAVADATPTS